jgi:hypothetical protein
MLPMVLMALVAGGAANCSCPASSTALSVQVVGPDWRPLPNIAVKVEGAVGPGINSLNQRTDRCGKAAFDVPDDAFYVVSAPAENGFAGQQVQVRLAHHGEDSTTAYVQLRLTVDLSGLPEPPRKPR